METNFGEQHEQKQRRENEPQIISLSQISTKPSHRMLHFTKVPVDRARESQDLVTGALSADDSRLSCRLVRDGKEIARAAVCAKHSHHLVKHEGPSAPPSKDSDLIAALVRGPVAIEAL